MKEKVLLKDLMNQDQNVNFKVKLFAHNDYQIDCTGTISQFVCSALYTKYENHEVRDYYIEQKNGIDYLVIKLYRDGKAIKNGYVYVIERSWMSDENSTSMSDVLNEAITLKEAEKLFKEAKNSYYNDDKTIIQLNKYSLDQDNSIDELLENKKSYYGKLAKRWIFGE